MWIKFKKLLKYFLLIILIFSFSQSITAGENLDANYRKWKKLSIQRKKQLRRKYKTWKSMSQEKRNEIIKAYKKFDRFTPQQRRRLKTYIKTFKNLPEKERKILINRYKKFQSLPVDKRREIVGKRIERLQNLREKAIRSSNKNNAERLNKRINVLKQIPNYRHTADAGVKKQQKRPKQIRKDRAKTGAGQVAPKAQKQISRVKREKPLDVKKTIRDKQKSHKKIQKFRQDKRDIKNKRRTQTNKHYNRRNKNRNIKQKRQDRRKIYRKGSRAGKTIRRQHARHKSRRPVHRKRGRMRR